MRYYKVLVSSQRFHGSEPLIYSSLEPLKARVVVSVPLQGQIVPGIVIGTASKPSFQAKNIVRQLTDEPLPPQSLALLKWLQAYYPAPLGSITAQFIPRTLGQIARQTTKKALPRPKTKALPPLTREQSSALKQINGLASKTVLLHGETGSGKTRVYLELAKHQLAIGHSVLVLTPEISLTPQLVDSFTGAFHQQVVLLHSNLTEAMRRNAWLSILESTKPLVIIGPRSALFAPIHKLGLIVVDEAHETAYKQEQAPYYQALRVASKLAALHSAQLIMGSATPSVVDYYIAKAKSIPVVRMQELAVKSNSPPTKVTVVASYDKAAFSQHHQLSDVLLTELGQTLEKGNQALIFLNRRGTARLVVCQQCGWQALCPNCELPLTYHGDTHSIRCHTCGHADKAPVHCPNCGSTKIIYKSLGTKSIVDTLVRLFPKARIQRFDTDNKKEERFEQHYERVLSGNVDILVGTQLLAKGLDLPRLSLVGVVAADTSLSFPDYIAEERTYQLLSQIIGRVGRGHQAGQAIIQTYNPDSPVITGAVKKDWESFYNQQLAERQQFMFPPFCYLLKLTCTRKTQKSAEETCFKLIEQIRELGLPIQVIGPAPSFYEKSAKGYSWQLVVKAKNRQHLVDIAKSLPSGWSYDLDPANLL
ncbi:MAG TPA: primosomal protein N' [Patescibacteria group bacterium]|nr:primosomal protein N' [Patescibacteria group bacterium]